MTCKQKQQNENKKYNEYYGIRTPTITACGLNKYCIRIPVNRDADAYQNNQIIQLFFLKIVVQVV